MQPTAEFGFDVDPLAEQREGRMFAKVVIPLGQKKGEASQRRARAECEEQYQLSLQQQRMDMQRQAIELEILKLRLEQMQRPSGTEDW